MMVYIDVLERVPVNPAAVPGLSSGFVPPRALRDTVHPAATSNWRRVQPSTRANLESCAGTTSASGLFKGNVKNDFELGAFFMRYRSLLQKSGMTPTVSAFDGYDSIARKY